MDLKKKCFILLVYDMSECVLHLKQTIKHLDNTYNFLFINYIDSGTYK